MTASKHCERSLRNWVNKITGRKTSHDDTRKRPISDVPGLAQQLFRGAGFFGSTKELSLSLRVDAEIDSVSVFIDAPHLEFLNIGAVVFYDESDKELPRQQIVASIKLSSDFGESAEDEVFGIFLRGGMLHSKAEIRPGLDILLTSSRFISRIEIRNRGDQFGARSRFVRVQAKNGSNTCLDYSNGSPDRHIEAVRELLSAEDSGKPSGSVNVEHLRDLVISGLAGGSIDWDARLLAEMLPVYEDEPLVTSFEEAICANIIVSLLGKSLWCETSKLQPLSSILRTDLVIENIADRAGKILTAKLGKPIHIYASKHRIQQSLLVMNKENFLQIMNDVLSVLQEQNIDAMICYGTLLGTVREGAFLAWDDDVDILYFDGSKSRAEALEKRDDLIAVLKSRGFSAWKPAGENFSASRGGVAVDLFPTWGGKDKLNVMMERFRYREISADVVLPPSKVTLYGEDYPAPHRPAAFLEDRYGADWKTPNPYHEWPWPVKRVASKATKGGVSNTQDPHRIASNKEKPRMVSAAEVLASLPRVDVPTLMVKDDFYSYKFISVHKAMEEVTIGGDFAQFGVYKGRMARFLLNYVRGSRRLHLFDSFEGLPTDWVGSWKAGAFKLSEAEIPKFDPKIVDIHKGWFSDSIPVFTQKFKNNLAFVHVDCDLYSSTKDVLWGVDHLINPGTIILFDEYMMTSEGKTDEGEHRALLEWRAEKGREFQYLWRTNWMQVAVRVLK